MANQAPSLTVELVDGTKIVVPDSLDHITSYVLQEQNDWFEDEIKFLRGLVQPGTTVVDIGANYGVYALSLARKVGSTGHVWAFEPATDTAELLRASASVNATDWLTVVQQALSDRQGTAWLQMPGQSELNSLANSDGAATEVGPGEAVTITTLDACLELFGWSKVDLLKIDAEGEEDRILLGGARFFRDLSPLVMFEVKAGMDLHLDLVDRFQELGYQCFHLIPGLDVLAPFDARQGVDGYLLNLFAAKPDRCQALAAAGKLVGYTDIAKADVDQAHCQLDSWLADLEKHPYAQSLAPRWLAKANQPQREAICQALAAWSISQDCSQPITKRFGALCYSYDLLNQECQLGCPVSRWASLTRVALALGERQRAIEAVSAMLTDLQSGEEPRMDEPFLCPDPAFDVVDPAGQLKAWLEAAGLSVIEQFGSFSGFFSAASALPRLERLISLGFANETTQRRMRLLTKRFGAVDQDVSVSQPDQQSPQSGSGSDLQDDLGTSARDWFHFLGLQKPLCCIDVGALALKGDSDPWIYWAQIGCAEVLGFEPLREECAKLNDQSEANGIAMRYLPWALGDGNEHTLNITNEPMTSSLFKPARSTIDLFPALGDLMHVVAEETVKTRRLDEIKEAELADFLKLDVQGAELMILENAKEVLRHVSVIQCEVEFIELYLGQPLMADVDSFLRSQGFTFLRFAYAAGRPFKPLQIIDRPYQSISQLLWADAIYVRDFRRLESWSNHQLRATSFLLHQLYDAFDLTAFLLSELDRRSDISYSDAYLSTLLLGNQTLGLGGL